MLCIFHIFCSDAPIACPVWPGTKFRRTLTIFCNQGPKIRERIHLVQWLIVNEYAVRYAVARHKLATLMFQCVSGTARGYLSSNVRRVADLTGQKHLDSALEQHLLYPSYPSFFNWRPRLRHCGCLCLEQAFPVYHICYVATCVSTPAKNSSVWQCLYSVIFVLIYFLVLVLVFI